MTVAQLGAFALTALVIVAVPGPSVLIVGAGVGPAVTGRKN